MVRVADLALGPVPMDKMEEFHERRHLLVHRLGRVDEAYIHRFKVDDAVLSVGEAYIADAFDAVRALALYVAKVELPVASPSSSAHLQSTSVVLMRLDPGTTPSLLNGDSRFRCGDQLVLVRDIVSNTHHDADQVQLTLCAPLVVRKAYVRKLRNTRGVQVLRDDGMADLPASETIEAIKQRLPIEPWPTGIHWTIATELGVPAKIVSNVLGAIRARLV